MNATLVAHEVPVEALAGAREAADGETVVEAGRAADQRAVSDLDVRVDDCVTHVHTAFVHTACDDYVQVSIGCICVCCDGK